MQPTSAIVRVVRAVGVEFARRTVKPIVIGGIVAGILLFVVASWLVVAVSSWWWLLLAPAMVLGLVMTTMVAVSWTLLRVIDAAESKEQRRAVAEYVDHLQRVSENLQTAQFVILYRVVRDVLRPSQDGFILTVSRDSKALAPGFKKLLAHFG